MSNEIQVLTQDIYGTRDQFLSVLSDKSISFDREASFAVQILESNSFAMSMAMRNRQSVVNAVVNVAAIGLSLNPARKHAYLVPRKTGIVLEISYMGLIELAVASGSIRWAKAELVRQADHFALNGYDKPPTHTFNPFGGDRGPVVGVYCVAKTADGDYLTETMTIDEVYAIRDRSEAWKNGQKGPWKTDEGEMIRKTVVKRASKYWPKTERLDQAVHYLNTDGGEGISDQPQSAAPVDTGFDITAALDLVQAAKTRTELDQIFSEHGAKATAAKDAGGYRALKAACRERAAEIEQVTDVEAKEPQHA